MAKDELIVSNHNIIEVLDMSKPILPHLFLNCLFHIVQGDGADEVILDMHKVTKAFPNTIVPMIGVIDFYKRHNITFVYHLSQYLSDCGFNTPFSPELHSKSLEENALDKVWRFSSETDVNLLGNALGKAVSENIICEEGVMEALMWSLNEVMDNVIQHSSIGYGYIMGQIHKRQKHISFCIYDNGQGIYNSLKGSIHAPYDALTAITLAIQERVTRDRNIGQGNGLWGLSEIVRNNSGRLSIASGSGWYFRSNGDLHERNDMSYLSKSNGATLIDFQLNYNKVVSLTDALKGHHPINYRAENFEDDFGFVNYRLADATTGTGTRKSGEKIRIDLINLFNNSKKGIILDFADLQIVSSSFADELVGKLLLHFGFFGFNQIVRLKNMNPTIQAVVERSVAQRMAEIIRF